MHIVPLQLRTRDLRPTPQVAEQLLHGNQSFHCPMLKVLAEPDGDQNLNIKPT